jgi:methyl-accepting chemotaxis protein
MPNRPIIANFGQSSGAANWSRVDLVGQTGKALTRIVEQVSEINGIVIHIASSAQEQSTALAQKRLHQPDGSDDPEKRRHG